MVTTKAGVCGVTVSGLYAISVGYRDAIENVSFIGCSVGWGDLFSADGSLHEIDESLIVAGWHVMSSKG